MKSSTERVTRIAHISDLHIDVDARHGARASRVVEYLRRRAEYLAGVVITGDLTQDGLDREYEALAEVLDPLSGVLPVFVCPGNHDDRVLIRRMVLNQPGDGPVNQVVRVGELTVLLCDAVVPGTSKGELGAATLEWLAEALRGSRGPTVVAFHQHPLALGVSSLDGSRLADAQALADVLADHPQVVGILCGHVHTAVRTEFAGIPLIMAPSTAYAWKLPLDRADPDHGGTEPLVVLHEFRDDRLFTYFQPCPDYKMEQF
ncbi:phosphodiesterase [Sphaerisporangium aureirubrum]|uniref:Phosphodiesterase n=1 Tax=Sphaerisporangium aureirubrum TaxID=1544736 RepID=A0ABW1NJZ6_9ACTN